MALLQLSCDAPFRPHPGSVDIFARLESCLRASEADVPYITVVDQQAQLAESPKQ